MQDAMLKEESGKGIVSVAFESFVAVAPKSTNGISMDEDLDDAPILLSAQNDPQPRQTSLDGRLQFDGFYQMASELRWPCRSRQEETQTDRTTEGWRGGERNRKSCSGASAHKYKAGGEKDRQSLEGRDRKNGSEGRDRETERKVETKVGRETAR